MNLRAKHFSNNYAHIDQQGIFSMNKAKLNYE